MDKPRFIIVEDSVNKQKVINIGYRKVIKAGDHAVIAIPRSLTKKLLGKYVMVKLIVDADVLEDV